MDARYFKFRLMCRDGGSGWGNTGQVAHMCAPGNTLDDATAYVKQHVPGGWSFKLIGPTKDRFYLKHLGGKRC